MTFGRTVTLPQPATSLDLNWQPLDLQFKTLTRTPGGTPIKTEMIEMLRILYMLYVNYENLGSVSKLTLTLLYKPGCKGFMIKK